MDAQSGLAPSAGDHTAVRIASVPQVLLVAVCGCRGYGGSEAHTPFDLAALCRLAKHIKYLQTSTVNS